MRKPKHSIRKNTQKNDPQKNTVPEEHAAKSDASRFSGEPEFCLSASGGHASAGPVAGEANPQLPGAEEAMPGTDGPDREEVRGGRPGTTAHGVGTAADESSGGIETSIAGPSRAGHGDRESNLELLGNLEEIVDLFGHACWVGERGCRQQRDDSGGQRLQAWDRCRLGSGEDASEGFGRGWRLGTLVGMTWRKTDNQSLGRGSGGQRTGALSALDGRSWNNVRTTPRAVPSQSSSSIEALGIPMLKIGREIWIPIRKSMAPS